MGALPYRGTQICCVTAYIIGKTSANIKAPKDVPTWFELLFPNCKARCTDLQVAKAEPRVESGMAVHLRF